MNQKTINIGILAHADAGKTSLTENLLFIGNAVKQKGSVDKGTASTDTMDIEKERGISVRTGVNSFEWEDIVFNIIDTPGHVDFSAEVERAISILDIVIVVVSAVEGVQSHTETIWFGLKEANIPILIFVNKIDRQGSDYELVCNEIIKELDNNIIEVQEVVTEEMDQCQINSWFSKRIIPDSKIDSIIELQDEMLNEYLNGREFSDEELIDSFGKSVVQKKVYPVFAGSVKSEVGINELLEGLLCISSNIKERDDDEFSALAFKIDHDKTLGKLVGIRVFSGKISAKDLVKNVSLGVEEKSAMLRKYQGGKLIPVETLFAGEVGGVSGFKETGIGDVLGTDRYVPDTIRLKEPLLTVQVQPKEKKDYAKLAEALMELSVEDPALGFEWNREEEEMHLHLMGWIQIEILTRILQTRYNIEAEFEDPTVIYKETPAAKAEGFARYWMPKPCWAIVKFDLEPGEPGSGVVYESKVSVDKIHQKYQNEIERTIKQALKQGIKGWEVTDLRITLIDGEDHEVHSRPGDFIIATPMAIMNGLVNSGTIFQEPVVSFKIQAPEELLGKVAGDITQMRGTFNSPEILDGKFVLQGVLPAATSMEYPVKLSSRSGGKAKISTRFGGYQKCADEHGVERPYKGISPLDESKYILKMRGAMQSGYR
jgi:ribosomal protection tetracycline resistance protein